MIVLGYVLDIFFLFKEEPIAAKYDLTVSNDRGYASALISNVIAEVMGVG